MAKPILSKRKSDAIANGAFLVSLGLLFYTNTWWPGILLALWITLALRQYFTGRRLDLVVSSVILLGLFCANFFKVDVMLLITLLFVLGGIYIIAREYLYRDKEEP